MDYDDARVVFTSDYDLTNPITKEAAWNDWMALLKQRNYEKYQLEMQKRKRKRWQGLLR